MLRGYTARLNLAVVCCATSGKYNLHVEKGLMNGICIEECNVMLQVLRLSSVVINRPVFAALNGIGIDEFW